MVANVETCTQIQQCGNGEQEYDCAVDLCTCKQDGVPGNQCPPDGFCTASFEEQRAAITACCGWDWE